CLAGGIWRYDYWSHSCFRGVEAGGPRSSRQFHSVADAWNIGPSHGGEPRHDGGFACAARSVDGGHDGAAFEPDSYFSCAVVSHAARDMHRAGEELEGRIAIATPGGRVATFCDLRGRPSNRKEQGLSTKLTSKALSV